MATLEDQHCSQLKFNIPQECARLSDIFSSLSAYKMESIIEDYSVSQTTLDDVTYLQMTFVIIFKNFFKVCILYFIADIRQIC